MKAEYSDNEERENARTEKAKNTFLKEMQCGKSYSFISGHAPVSYMFSPLFFKLFKCCATKGKTKSCPRLAREAPSLRPSWAQTMWCWKNKSGRQPRYQVRQVYFQCLTCLKGSFQHGLCIIKLCFISWNDKFTKAVFCSQHENHIKHPQHRAMREDLQRK